MTRWLLLTLAGVVSAQDHDLNRLSWMSGCWAMNKGTLTIEEHWSKPAAGNMMGYSRTLRGSRMAFLEYIRLEQADGQIRYIARIGPQDAGTPFKLVKLTENEAEFSNPDHDFPQTIRYRRVSKDELHARIEGVEKGKAKGQDFPYRRTACE